VVRREGERSGAVGVRERKMEFGGGRGRERNNGERGRERWRVDEQERGGLE